MRFLPVGPRTFLIELDDLDAMLALFDALQAEPVDGIAEIVPGARTLMIRTQAGYQADSALAGQILDRSRNAGSNRNASPAEVLDIPMVYDGEDLDEVAQILQLSRGELIAAHQAASWQVAFCGFAPGFAYMVCDDPRFDLPRRTVPRKQIPPGAVALAGGFCGIYPRQSPGGWQLIGRTGLAMWDLDRDPAALLRPGMRVRFREGDVAPVTAEPANRTTGQPALQLLESAFPIRLQDEGRPGLAAQGVPASGALDRGALRRANRAVGNPSDMAALEITLGPARLLAHQPVTLALSGAATARIGQETVPGGAAFALDPGDRLEIMLPDRGMHSYLAMRGGFDSPAILGARASDTLSGIGPAPLLAGALLGCAKWPASAVGTPQMQPALPRAGEVVELPVTLGPRSDWFPDDMLRSFLAQDWLVTPDCSRVGLRLQGDAIIRSDARELPSEGVETGAVQIPHSGQPVLFLADHPVTGGYPVIATLLPHAIDLAGQIPPGARIRFSAAAGFSPIIPARSK